MKHLVIIGTVFPEPNSTAAGSRMMQLIRFFLSENYKITFLCAALPTEYSTNLESIGVQTKTVKLNDSSFEKVIQELNPDTVLFDRFTTEEQFGWKVAEVVPQAVRILDTEDLHFLRKGREEAFKQGVECSLSHLTNDIFKREMASILRCDLSLIISEFEMDLLTNTFKIQRELLHYLPLFAENSVESPGFEHRRHFISIGNFLHEPNWQTVLGIKKIWKEIRRQIHDAEVHIYGAYVPQKAMQLHNVKEGFLVKGRASDVAEVFNKARVLLAPIPFGAGIKGKLLDAMSLGLPNVTSSIGAEAIPGLLPWSGHIADEEADFIEKAAHLYRDSAAWDTARNNGFRIINERFSKDLFLPDFSSKLVHISENLSELRAKNFMGQILQHHQFQSTKYMGKWIEEKNREPFN
ncbi:glycosyltransferase family 4 protein [Kaistella sp. PBT33-4]|uniref:glycosyltransferase family 4 protein n=1 Tax=Kaistella sp. PBT33-4 TaxID=3032000 RepID=UPI0023D82181|nr:glycosyltransferase family 4 protein [Kaistella sp. PBT33-4]MDF0720036.1 glycosyltransferase family 4 protein [Kaistella sp. PBT33-4]